MEERFVPLNAFIALCSSAKTGWPRPLFDAGFRLEAIEFPALTAEGRVVVDAVAWSPTDTHFILGEAKSGANIDEVQAKKYSNVQAGTLVQMLGVTLTKEAVFGRQVVYVVVEEHAERVLLGLTSAGVGFPVIAISEESVRCLGGVFEHPALAKSFVSPLPVPGPPPGIITIDNDSSDEDFDLVVQTSLVALLASHGPVISIPNLAEDAIPYLPIYPNGYRNRLIRKVEDAARRAVNSAPDTFFFTPSNGVNAAASVRVIESPESLDPRGRTQRYQSLVTRFASPSRRRPTVVASNQPSLFDDANYNQELAQLDLVDENDVEEESNGPQ